MRGPPRLLPIAGGVDHTLFSTPLRGGSNPTCLNKTPHSGVHRASCPSRAGGTTFSSPPRQGCLTQRATTRPRYAGVHRASCPSRAGGDHILFSTPLRGVSNPTCLNKTPHSGVHRASCPSRAGGTTFSSPPRQGCLTQHATTNA